MPFEYDPDAPWCFKCAKLSRVQQTKWGLRHQCLSCGDWSWEGKPLADARTHAARKAAHQAFDVLWKDGAMTRSEAYRALKQELGLLAEMCHMSIMDAEVAERVPGAVKRIMGLED